MTYLLIAVLYGDPVLLGTAETQLQCFRLRDGIALMLPTLSDDPEAKVGCVRR